MRARTRHARAWVWGAIALIIGWFALGGVIGPAAGQLSSAQENDNATFLPADAEATQVIEKQQLFADESTLPVVVLFVTEEPITPEQQEAVAAFVDAGAVPGGGDRRGRHGTGVGLPQLRPGHRRPVRGRPGDLGHRPAVRGQDHRRPAQR